jgi:hypothetical protein
MHFSLCMHSLTNYKNVVFTVENVEKRSICTLELDSKKIQQFSDAIESSYWFEFFIGAWIYTWSVKLCCITMIWAIFLFLTCTFWTFFHFLPRRSFRWSASLGYVSTTWYFLCYFCLFCLLPDKKFVCALTGFVGETDKNSENKHYLYTHKNILVKYNDNRVCILHWLYKWVWFVFWY